MNILLKFFLKISLVLVLGLMICVSILTLYTLAQLPSVQDLQAGTLQIPLKIYTADHQLIGEFGEHYRTPIKLSAIPKHLKQAILATEDRRFYEHHGVDPRGLLRASFKLLTTGTKEQGASTITMQVARNFFLSRKKTFHRKFTEILLALKIDKELSKDQILELYLNKIYFGKKAHGIAAAAEVYFNRPVHKLSLDQMALLAGLPQAPSYLNPISNPAGALKRRNHVLNRMLFYKFITPAEHKTAIKAPIHLNTSHKNIAFAPYIAEMVRQEMLEKYGEKAYTEGFEVTTTINTNLQKNAQEALQSGLRSYDKRHGYRGSIKNTGTTPKSLQSYPSYPPLIPAMVTHVSPTHVGAIFADGKTFTIPFEGLSWAVTAKNIQAKIRINEVIYVEKINNAWSLSQLPVASAALVSIRPQDGAILSLVGGYHFQLSSFNRATQALRQPGSNFKPFIYAAALERDFTAASIINDAPLVIHDPSLTDAWRPKNDSKTFNGPTRLRVALVKSINLVSIRILEALRIPPTLKFLKNFGFESKNLPPTLSLALGTGSITPLQLATRYATFANGGYKVDAYLITKIVRKKRVLFTHKPPIFYEASNDVQDLTGLTDPNNQNNPNSVNPNPANPNPAKQAHLAPRVLSAQSTYIMNSLLTDAIQHGTGAAANRLNRTDLAGKTGTTNNNLDAWFSGFHPTIVTTVWVGFDDPKSLKEYGGQVALPIWIDFMGHALKNTPHYTLSPPPGLVRVLIDPKTGLLAYPDQKNAVLEIFTTHTVPTEMAPYSEDRPTHADPENPTDHHDPESESESLF